MTSNASYMVKGNARIDDMSSQGSFMIKAGGIGQSERGSIMVKGAGGGSKGSMSGSDDGGKAELDDSQWEVGHKSLAPAASAQVLQHIPEIDDEGSISLANPYALMQQRNGSDDDSLRASNPYVLNESGSTLPKENFLQNIKKNQQANGQYVEFD